MQSQNFNHVQSCPFLPGALGEIIFYKHGGHIDIDEDALGDETKAKVG